MNKRLLFGAALVLLTLTGCYNGKQQEKETASPSFDEVLTTRRSVRSYDASKKISEAEVRELLLATQEAPSWANQQPRFFTCLQTFTPPAHKNIFIRQILYFAFKFY